MSNLNLYITLISEEQYKYIVALAQIEQNESENENYSNLFQSEFKPTKNDKT